MEARARGGRSQRGFTLFGLLFWAIIVGFLALIGMRVLPALNEYFTIKRAINKIATEGATVPEIRTAFERQKDIEYSITSISGKDLQHHQGKRQGRGQLRLRQGNRAHEAGLPSDQVRGPVELDAAGSPTRALFTHGSHASSPCSSASATASPTRASCSAP